MTLGTSTGWSRATRTATALELAEKSLAQQTLLAAEPILITDLQEERRFTIPALLVEHGIRAGVCVRIVGSPRAYGILGVFVTRPRLFSPEDVDFLQSIGHVLSLAVQRDAHGAGGLVSTATSGS